VSRAQQPRRRRWASLATAAAYYDCSQWTLRKYISSGDLPAYYVGKRRSIKVDLNDLDDLAVRVPSSRAS